MTEQSEIKRETQRKTRKARMMTHDHSNNEIESSQYGQGMIKVFGIQSIEIDPDYFDLPEPVKSAAAANGGKKSAFIAHIQAFEADGKIKRLDKPIPLIVFGTGKPAEKYEEFGGKNCLEWDIDQTTVSTRLVIRSGTLRELLNMNFKSEEFPAQFPTEWMTLLKDENNQIFCLPVNLDKQKVTDPEVLNQELKETGEELKFKVLRTSGTLSPNAAFLIARSNFQAPRIIRAAMAPVARIDDHFDLDD